MLSPNFSVTTTAQKVFTAKPGTRQINVTNNNVGGGTVYAQLVPNGAATTLTTSVYTFAVPSQPNPYEYILTPGFQNALVATYSPKSYDLSQGFDVYLVGSAAAQVNVQSVPF